MIKDTSRIAYANLIVSGKGKTQREKLYVVIAESGPITRAELSAITGVRINAVCGRVKELLNEEVIEELSVRACSQTYNKAHPLKVAEL